MTPLAEFNYDLPTHDDLTAQLEASLRAHGIEPIPVAEGTDLPSATGENSSGGDDQPADLTVRQWLQERIEVIGQHPEARMRLQAGWPVGVPTLRSSDAHTPDQLEVIERLLGGIEREHDLSFPPARP
jgi:hypothetical protein